MSPSTPTSAPTPNSVWPHASPNPSTLEGGRQLEGAPMCPCSRCWEYGSHTLAPPRPPKAPKAPKTETAKKSPLQLFKKSNASKESVASDMQPLKQSAAPASVANSVYGDAC